MNMQVVTANLAHYIYISVEDEQIAKAVWDHQIQRHGLAGFNIEDYITGVTGPTYEFPILIRNSGIAVGLSVERRVITISTYYLDAARPTADALDELENMRENLQEHIGYFIGETSVLVTGKADGEPRVNDMAPFDQAGTYSARIRDGALTFIQADEDERRYYRLVRHGESDATGTLTKELPLMDMLVFKLAKQSTYFHDQHTLLMGKKGEIDRGVSDVLHTWAGVKSTSGHNIHLLEEDTEKLSLMYAELASSLKIIKNAGDTTSRDVERLESVLAALLVDYDESRGFRDALLGEFKNLQSLLAFDDEVLHRTLNDIRATIEVVRTRIELERSRESFVLQKEGISVQIAAGFIELFIVGFYTLETWHLLAGEEVFEHIPAFMRLGLDLSFAISAVAVTHYIAKYLRKERGYSGIALSSLGVIASALLMVAVTRIAAG